MKEVDFYPEIASYFSENMQANFDCYQNRKLNVYFAHTQTLERGLKSIISTYSLSIKKLDDFVAKAPPLFLDIFGIVTDGIDFELVILEIKYVHAVGLTELSQLVGYSMVSSSTYGFLINVDGRPSPYLQTILATNDTISDIVTDYNGNIQHHYFNVMEWDSISKNIRYTTYGKICSISSLCESIERDFDLLEIVRKIDAADN